jgi:hypothetical protein
MASLTFILSGCAFSPDILSQRQQTNPASLYNRDGFGRAAAIRNALRRTSVPYQWSYP